MRRTYQVGAGILLLSAIVLGTACSTKKAQSFSVEAVPVTVGTVMEKTVPVEVKTIGTVEAYSTVSIKAQVNGELTGVYFKEGQDVKQGDLLFTIDHRAYEAQLKQAEANLARDVAQLKDAELQEARAQQLNKQGIVSKEVYDHAQASADALRAAVQADHAVIENTRVLLSYCTINAPIGGRTGTLMVHKGNLVKANDVPVMVVINQIQPIYVDVAVPEQFLSDIKKYQAQGKLEMRAYLPGDKARPEEGVVSFVDNTVDRSTGTIKVKATFSNPQRRLWPGQFVDTELILTHEPNALVVPSQTIQTGQKGQYVYVVKNDLTVEARPVEVDRSLDGETVIRSGLRAGERVVTDGQLRLVPGTKVEIKLAAAGG